MRGSIIILKGTQEDRKTKTLEIINKELSREFTWEKLAVNPDFFIISKPEDRQSIGIKQVKEGIGFLNERPLALKCKTIIVENADILTDDAQNAFLKELEEPPTYALILLLSKTENALLPTVLSRCRKIECNYKDTNEIPDEMLEKYQWEKFDACTMGEKLEILEDLNKEEREDVIKILENWVVCARRKVIQNAQKIKVINEVIGDLENTNAQLKLALEYLVVCMCEE